MSVLLAVAAAVVCVLWMLAWRDPVARRLAGRRLRRRPVDGALVVAAAALGTALVSGSLLIGDTLQASLVDRATVRLGPVDVVVRSFAPVIADAVGTTLEFDPPPAADGLLDVLATDGSIIARGATGPAAVVPETRLLELDFAAAREFGGDPAAAGISGPTPAADGVVLTDDLSEELGVGAGDTVDVYAYGRSRTLTIERVLPAEGLAGFATTFAPSAYNAFVGPDLIRQLAFDPEFPPAARPPETLVLVSAVGDALAGVARSDELVGQLRDRFETFPGFDISAVKQDALDAAEDDAAAYAELFTSLAAFAILAGVALLANLFVMLATDRRAELGVLRAVGLQRRGVWTALVLEGGAYALAGAVLGGLAGVGVARVLVVAGGEVLSGVQRAGVPLQFAARPSTLVVGTLVGVLVALAALSVVAVVIGRLQVMDAIRGLPSRSVTARSTVAPFVVSVVALLAAAAATVVAFISGDDLGRLALPSMSACLLAVAVLRRPGRRPSRGRRDAVVTVTAVAVLAWSLLALGVLEVDDADVGVFVVQGVVMTAGGVVLLAGPSARLGGLMRGVPGRWGTVLRLALTYPANRPGRTGATVATYSLVVYTLVFSSVLSGFFSGQVEDLVRDEGGGAEVLVTTNTSSPVPAETLAGVEGVEAVASLAWSIAEFRVGGRGAYEPWALSGYDEQLLALGPPRLDTWDTTVYPDEAAVWRAVLADPGLAIADAAFLQRGGGPPQDNVAVGHVIDVRGPGADEPTALDVVAISAAGTAFSGVLTSRAAAAEVATEGVLNRHHLALAEDAVPQQLAADLERAFLPSGTQVRTFAEVVDEALAGQEAFFDLIEGYLALGLLVGIGGVGAVAARSVRERRRELAIARAIGVDATTIRWSVVLESTSIALQGSLLGSGLAVFGGYQLISNAAVFGEVDAPVTVPWIQLLALLAITVTTSSLASVVPAARAARRTPAAGLRVDVPIG